MRPEVFCGVIGSDTRAEYTVMGDNVRTEHLGERGLGVWKERYVTALICAMHAAG